MVSHCLTHSWKEEMPSDAANHKKRRANGVPEDFRDDFTSLLGRGVEPMSYHALKPERSQ
jgi:hypothetical protein